MKTPLLTMLIFFLTTTLAVACAAPNATFCESDDQCSVDAVCDLEAHQCEYAASADAGSPDALIPSEPERNCSSESQQCLGAAPEGWTGPIARADARDGEPVLGCTEDFSEDGGLFGTDIVSSGSCTCECGGPTSLACSGATLREWTSSSEGACEQGVCDIVGSSCAENSQFLSPGVCTRISANMVDEPFLRATFGIITGATCEQPEVSGQLASEFAVQVRLCETNLETVECALDDVCAPQAPTGFSEGLCIASPGEHECPSNSGYVERTLLYSGIDDDRQCDVGSCSCDAPTGSCGGKVELHNGGVDDDLCNGALATLKRSSSPLVDDNVCQSLPASASTARYVVDPAAHSCRAEGETDVAGAATGTGVTTLCCMP